MASTRREVKISNQYEEGGMIANTDAFVLIEASKLSLNDSFMKHSPRTQNEIFVKELLINTISHGPKDFYISKFDPCFNSRNVGIRFKAGCKPAVGKSYKWWQDTAKKFAPERQSRLGTKSEYILFLGVLIKKLVEEGWSIKAAWHAVCVDSRELGHYKNSKDAKQYFEWTGSREICGFFDLANTWKILDEDEYSGGFWLASGDYIDFGDKIPIANFEHEDNCFKPFYSAVGWIVLE